MITNLLATVVLTLVTNVTERVPMHQEPAASPVLTSTGWTDGSYRYKLVPDSNPTNKWIRTTITERECLQFEFRGQRRQTLLSERVISDVEVEQALRREESWSVVRTNDVLGKTLIDGTWYAPFNNWSMTNMTGDALYWSGTNVLLTNAVMMTNQLVPSIRRNPFITNRPTVGR